MRALKMAVCGVIIAMVVQDMVFLCMGPLLGFTIHDTLPISGGMGMRVSLLATLYRDEVKEYLEIIFRRPK